MICNRHIKVLSEEPIGGQTIISLIVMSRGVGVLVESQIIYLSVKIKERLDGVVEIGFDDLSSETAVIFRVERQESGSWSTHRRKCRVVLVSEDVCASLLIVSGGSGHSRNPFGQRVIASD